MKKAFVFFVVFVMFGFLIPETRVLPVIGATKNDWHPDTYWYEPWGSSGTHKGMDIFADEGVDVVASTSQVILYKGAFSKGGNVVISLGPKWRVHYYAHLSSIHDDLGFVVGAGQKLGEVGDSGNAKGKAPHLHYSIRSLVPLIWQIDNATQGYKKAFFIDPSTYFYDAI